MNVLEARFVASARQAGGLPPPAFPELAFAGRSNVGKSSLINAVVGRRNLARASRTPGCTRGINLFRITWNEGVADLADLPGYGYARRSKAEKKSWRPLVEGFLRSRSGLRAVVLIVDVRRGIEDEERQLLELLSSLKLPAILVATKLDRLVASKRKPALAQLRKGARVRVLGFSAVTGEGLEELQRAVQTALREQNQPADDQSGA